MVVCVYSSPLLNARGWCHLIFICWFTFRYVSSYVNVPLLIAALSSIFSKPLKCGDSKLTTIYFIPCLSKPMLMVVSILSPVKTHIFIPPWASLSMHPGTYFEVYPQQQLHQDSQDRPDSATSSIMFSLSALLEFLASFSFSLNLATVLRWVPISKNQSP